jgi:cell wall-associated NlpC family hydrolase
MSRRLPGLLPALSLAAVLLALAAVVGGMVLASEPGAAAGATVAKPRPRPSVRRHRPSRPLGERAARIALRAVGVPYRWGGASPSTGFDCSGLVYWAYGRLGVSVPHSSYALYEAGKRASRRNLKPGDVLVFSGLGHVGLYLGRGRMVHAPQSGRRVEIVRLRGSRYGERLVAARRVAPRLS